MMERKDEKHYITEVHVEGMEMLTSKQQTPSVPASPSPSQEHILPWEREDIVLPNP